MTLHYNWQRISSGDLPYYCYCCFIPFLPTLPTPILSHHIHTYTHIHTIPYIYTHTYNPIHKNTYIQSHPYLHTHTLTHIHTIPYIHTYIHTHPYTHTSISTTQSRTNASTEKFLTFLQESWGTYLSTTYLPTYIASKQVSSVNDVHLEREHQTGACISLQLDLSLSVSLFSNQPPFVILGNFQLFSSSSSFGVVEFLRPATATAFQQLFHAPMTTKTGRRWWGDLAVTVAVAGAATARYFFTAHSFWETAWLHLTISLRRSSLNRSSEPRKPVPEIFWSREKKIWSAENFWRKKFAPLLEIVSSR